MKTICAFAILFISGVICAAQQDSVQIGPGDQIHIQVLEAPELEQHVRVMDSGEVHLILGGNVKLAGLSTADAAHVIEEALISGNYVLHPHANVTADRYVTQNVSVLGQVRTPGAYPISTPRTVLDVLALAGGETELGDTKITIQRHGTREKIEYTVSNKAAKALDDNVEVFPGDTIFVPKVNVVYVLGDVRRPGGFPMSTNDSKLSVLQAVALAGTTNPSAVPSHARLIRKQEDGSYVEIPVPLSAMQKGKKSDMAMQADDILYVPFSYLRNMGSSLGNLLTAAASASIYRY